MQWVAAGALLRYFLCLTTREYSLDEGRTAMAQLDEGPE